MIITVDIWFIVALSIFLLVMGLLGGMFLSHLLRQG